MADLDQILEGMTGRQVEDLMRRAQKRLRACVMCGSDGAAPVLCTCKNPNARFTLLLCPACIEKNRLPEGRAEG